MKKFVVLLSICLCLSLNVIHSKPAFAVGNTFTQGIHSVSDFNISPNDLYIFSNVSKTDKIHLIFLDEKQDIVHTIRLGPNSEEHLTVPIKPNYKVIIIGNGILYINPKPMR